LNTRRLIGLIVLALFASWLVLRGCTREEAAPPPPAEPTREAFHASKPLHLIVAAQAPADGTAPDMTWLERELRHLLTRGQMRIARADSVPKSAFVLRVSLSPDQKRATLELIAPDEVVERHSTLDLTQASRLGWVTALAEALPAFLEASHASQQWTAFIGTEDAAAYESFVRATNELLGSSAQGVTRPALSRPRARLVERLESLVRRQPRFARAWATLAIGYLSLGGEDIASLNELAEATAERALTIDQQIAEAHAALGVVDLRHNDWIAAHGKFEHALALDANLPIALEGLACLHVDAGHYRAALPYAQRAVKLQPRNAGANECLAYAQLVAEEDSGVDAASTPSATRVRALTAALARDRRNAERLLRSATRREEFDAWAGPMLHAIGNRRLVPEALRAITRAANDGLIDASTEILCGVALREPEFVFNRIARLQNEDAHAPLRVLWVPTAKFLREHARFEQTIGAAGLTAFWHGNGPPDICTDEPDVYGCNLKGTRRIATTHAKQ